MSFFSVSVLSTAIASLLLAAFIYSKGPAKPLNRALALFSLALAVWTFAQVMAGIGAALLWVRIEVGAAVFLPVFFLGFIFSLLGIDQEKKNILRRSYAVAFIFILLDFTPWFVGKLNPLPGFRYYPELTAVYAAFALWLIASFLFGLGYLIAALRQASGEQYQKYLYVFAASFIGFVGGGTSFFPIFNIQLPIVSHFALPLYVAIAVYAIVMHKLLDITVYVRKGLVYSFITALFTALYVALLYYFQSWVQYGSIMANVCIVLGMCLLFQPLRDWTQTWIDNIFFKSHYDFQETVRRFSQVLSTVFRPEDLDRLVQHYLGTTLKVKKATIARDKRDAALTVPIEGRGRHWGYLCLGEKLSGDVYSSEDINLLETLASQIAVALENIELYQKLARSENIAALGTLAAGMAHEIRNPLASIKGMTQILPENMDDKEFMQKYAEIIPRQLDRINQIVEDLLKAGKPAKLEMQPTDVNAILNEVLDCQAALCEKQGIKVVRVLGRLPAILAERDSLQQVCMNVTLNAIDAMPAGGVLEVSSREEKGQIVIEITDTGAGIPADKLDKVFEPFFTLKEKGTGLGLFMALRMVQAQGGTIEIESPGRGTKVRVRLTGAGKEYTIADG